VSAGSNTEPVFDPFQLAFRCDVRIIVLNIKRIDPFVPNSCDRMIQKAGQRMEHVDIGASLDIENIASFPRFDIMRGPKLFQALANFRLVRQVIGTSLQQKRQVVFKRLIEDHLRMGHDNNL